ncbi:hypothetical protein G6F46_005438 [Rhizopus delemar]|uniref:Uncharacterized protein n=2 Tax=Rhizopus TaxID=4842 RepID=A0A9P7CQA6_9FUNG|nr:hypothetical protein G6F55_006475 [Rhizopus delemar]KAG1540299.1 hypothetical protein G6F51_008607 [Rhizopus arrhizus]KAG1495579.1 hypothetical protein G6F54_007073 [Rhizopus delemar]KAG1512673.1 hypothetical protein G6F53_005013 [Rhizopus delemar]KAG1519844.1 hypothetical protein G6F52_008229 [Rhizopus delemar]
MSSSFVVFSGGSACNHILNAFHKVSNHQVSYVLGVSDNGGSTSELLRVLHGPSVGDLRSRLLKLMDLFNHEDQEAMAIKNLLSYRLPVHQQARDEWSLILEGRHKLWFHISIEKKEAIHSFLALFNIEILKRAHKRFNFCNGSIGNFLLTGARIFTGSLEAALFLFASIIGVPGLVTPVVNTDQTVTIAATLLNGSTLTGQCEISHPSTPISADGTRCIPKSINLNDRSTSFNEYDDTSSLHSDESTNLFFSKHVKEKLDSPIRRIYYVNDYGQEIYPVPNPKVISLLSTKQSLIYSIGSLYTSLVPCLILRNVGNAIAYSQSLKHKVLLLNGSQDRETHGYTALDFIHTIAEALNESQHIDARRTFYDNCQSDGYDTSSRHINIHTPPSSYPPFPDHLFYPSPISAFITHVIYLDNTTIPVDVDAIKSLGIQCISIQGSLSKTGEPVYLEHSLTEAIESLVS